MDSLKVLLLAQSAHLPEKATDGDLGYDLFALEAVTIPKGEMLPVKTGIAIEFPEGWGGIIKDRSSMAMKRVTTSAGVIDNGYRGEIIIFLTNGSDNDFAIEQGGKIAQLVPQRVTDWNVVAVENLNDTARGTGGFGSTGEKKIA